MFDIVTKEAFIGRSLQCKCFVTVRIFRLHFPETALTCVSVLLFKGGKTVADKGRDCLQPLTGMNLVLGRSVT